MAIIDTSPARIIQVNAPVVAGFFAQVREAHMTVTDLRDHGFRVRQIGAAFRSDLSEALSSDVPPEKPRAANAGSPLTPTADFETFSQISSRDRFPRWLAGLRRGASSSKYDDNFRAPRYPLAADLQEQVHPAGNSFCEPVQEQDFTWPEFAGLLEQIGLASEVARSLAHNLTAGGAIVTVTCIDQCELAERILARHHGRLALVAKPESMDGQVPSSGSEAVLPLSARADVSGEPPPASYRVQLFGDILRLFKDRAAQGEADLNKKMDGSSPGAGSARRKDPAIGNASRNGNRPIAHGAPTPDISRGGEGIPLEKRPEDLAENGTGKRRVFKRRMHRTVGGPTAHVDVPSGDLRE